MRNIKHLLILLTVVFFAITAFRQSQTEPWTEEQLMQPERLAAIINDSTVAKPLIINVGPVNSIKGAIKTGPAKEKDNLNELEKLLSKEDRKKAIVIYCGCCPFKDCPNIRPAFSLLTKMSFTNHKLLNMPHNLKTDWINHGYPMNN
jgi:thiosulfate/3-mercaptopyruvate sulfurtransferase